LGVHWARRANPFFINLVDSLDELHRTQDLGQVVADEWSASGVAELNYVLGTNDATTRRNCPAPKQGRIRMCNYNYGATGWTGLATWWPDSNNHILKATAKLNDFYFTEGDVQLQTLCHEVGHGLGLDHREATSTSCLQPASIWPAPDQHDFDMLATIYRHSDGYRTSMRPPTEGGVFLPLVDEEIAVTTEAQSVGCVMMISWVDGTSTTEELPLSECSPSPIP